jgi:hypothetical protein
MWQMFAASHDVVSYNDFLRAHFTPLEIADALLVARGVDLDGDARNNLSEYYFGTHPRLLDAMPESLLSQDSNRLVFEHRTRVRPPNGRMVWESSPDLIIWNAAVPGSISFVEMSDGLFQLKADFPWPSTDRVFYRVRAVD